MKWFGLFVKIFLLTLLVVLLIQNAFNVKIKVFFWKFDVPLSLLVFLFALLGFLVGILLKRRQ